ncbi:MAG: lysophospholipase [Rhodothermia bacterium]|nr:lysophospholipase [Rhodothermia bacterium]
MTTRREFLRLSAFSALSPSLMAEIRHLVQSANAGRDVRSMSAGPTVLFQGDSITDAGRDRANYYANSGPGMGSGYVRHVVTQLLGKSPDEGYRFYNRGISGNKVHQLADRWVDDCLNLKPDVLSILIGVNDFWHTLGGAYDGTVELYDADYRQLLDRTLEDLPEVALIIGEPFAVQGGSAIDDRWVSFHAYRRAARRIAEDYGAVFVPYHKIFAAALQQAPADYWCPDGVHPSMAGCYLMKEAWLAGFDEL